MRLPDFTGMYTEIGSKLVGTLVCERCKRRQPCGTEAAAEYLAHGWPKCCGYTMTLTSRGQTVRAS